LTAWTSEHTLRRVAREPTQADISVAETLLAAQRPDDQIVAALVYRGLESNVASTLIQNLSTGMEPNPKLAAAVEEAPMTGVLHHAIAAFLAILFAVLIPGSLVFLLFELGSETSMYGGPVKALILAGGVVVSMLAGAFLRCRAGRWWFVLHLVLAGVLWAIYCFRVFAVACFWGGGGHGFLGLLLLVSLPALCWLLGVLLSLLWRPRRQHRHPRRKESEL
jgi:hypothetical protein